MVSSSTTTALCEFIFPNLENTSWILIWRALMNQFDNKIYSNLENPNLILTGGGAVSLNEGTDTLSWTEDFVLINLLTGGVVTITAGSLAGFVDGGIAYLSIARPVSGALSGTLAVTNILGNDTSKLFIALRRDSVVYVRNNVNRASVSSFTFWGATKVTTDSITNGESGSGSIAVGISEGSVWRLQVTAIGNTVDSTIHFYSDAGLTTEIYIASNKDCYTSSYDDRTPWWIGQLTAGQVYYQIDNDGANPSVYDIELVGSGNMAV